MPHGNGCPSSPHGPATPGDPCVCAPLCSGLTDLLVFPVSSEDDACLSPAHGFSPPCLSPSHSIQSPTFPDHMYAFGGLGARGHAGCVGAADNLRRREPPPPGPRFHSGKNEVCKRKYGFVPPPPLPPSSLLMHPLGAMGHAGCVGTVPIPPHGTAPPPPGL